MAVGRAKLNCVVALRAPGEEQGMNKGKTQGFVPKAALQLWILDGPFSNPHPGVTSPSNCIL